MSVDPANAAAKIDHAGQSYYFCSKGCAQRFAQSPDQYVAAAIGSRKHSSLPIIQSNAVANSTPVAVPNHGSSAKSAPTAASEGVRYTCPMHPQIVHMGPGSCPICGMALEPMDPLASRADPNTNIRQAILDAQPLPLRALSMLGDHLSASRSTVRN
jgi:Cu+-exporting ATPase